MTQLVWDGPNPIWSRRVIARHAEVPVTMTDGAELTVTASLDEVPEDHVLDLVVRNDLFYAGVPSSDFAYVWLSMHAFPPETRGYGFVVATVVVNGVEAVPVSLHYGDPFPASWQRVISAGTPNSPTTIGLSLEDAQAAGEIAPRLSAVEELAIAGRPVGDAVLEGVGYTPTITWRSPSRGTPDSYWVSVLSAERWPQSSLIITADTEVTLPPGILRAGFDRIEVTAVEGTSIDNPMQSELTRSSARRMFLVTP
jgi:hypothetical protein